jgi:hypothetical protein
MEGIPDCVHPGRYHPTGRADRGDQALDSYSREEKGGERMSEQNKDDGRCHASVRIDKGVWKRFQIMCIELDVTIQDGFTDALRRWVAAKQEEQK